ncbi:hypothetical protein ACFE04_023234 [Oxalis oulophora]
MSQVPGIAPPVPGMFPNMFQMPTGQQFGAMPIMPVQAMTQQVHAVEKTPSMSELNEMLLAQEHFKRSDLSFVFRLQVLKEALLRAIDVCRRTSSASSVRRRSSSAYILDEVEERTKELRAAVAASRYIRSQNASIDEDESVLMM